MHYLENKIPPPIITAIVGLIMWLSASFIPGGGNFQRLPPQNINYLLIGPLLLMGLLFLASGAISFRLAKTTVNPLKPETATTLVTSGIYRITRNPMYVGFAILLCAWAVYLGSLWSAPAIILFIIYIQCFQIHPEEKALGAIFEDDFTNYKHRVRPWL